MSIAERARELARALTVSSKPDYQLIEQALLAERRLAKLEDAELVEARRDPDCICESCDECVAIAEAIRAAAETEKKA